MFEKTIQYHRADNDEIEESTEQPPRPSYTRVILVLLFVSCVINIGFAVKKFTHSATQVQPTSKNAGLQYNIQRPFQHSTEYCSSNKTRMQELWDGVNFDPGVIYITPEHADSMKLPPSQNFPWDSELKIYLLNGYHNLHCLQSIQRSLVHLAAGRPPTYPMAHVMHCLDTLRDDVLCHADDTPRYITTTPEAERAGWDRCASVGTGAS